MKCLAFYIFHIRVVQVISDQWKAEVLHMYTYLVCAACLKLQPYEAVGIVLP